MARNLGIDPDPIERPSRGVTLPQTIAAAAEIAYCSFINDFNRLADTDLEIGVERFRG